MNEPLDVRLYLRCATCLAFDGCPRYNYAVLAGKGVAFCDLYKPNKLGLRLDLDGPPEHRRD